jgi:hypothetical protein
MNEKIKQLVESAPYTTVSVEGRLFTQKDLAKFAELVVKDCIGREELLGAIARGWCHEKNSHKIMDNALALAIFNEIEQQIKSTFGIK